MTAAGTAHTPTSPVVPQTHTVLTLTGLPAHTSVSLGFLLAVIDSWDGTSTESFEAFLTGRIISMSSVDNVLIFSATYHELRRARPGTPPASGGPLLDWPNNLGFNLLG